MTENIKDISFVIIARNEEFALQKCLDSLEKLELTESEIILVDSDSNDNTINLMKNFAERNPSNTIVLKCSGYLNASVGRNAGLGYATKEYVFFVDGDTELNPHFINESLNVFNTKKNIIAVTGRLSEIYYSINYKTKLRDVHDRFKINREKIAYSSGGNIIIRRKTINEFGGWDIRLPENEDYFLASKIIDYGYLLAIPITMGVHHTKEYSERVIGNFLKGYPVYFGYIIKKNISKFYFLYHLLKGNLGYSVGLLFYLMIVITILLSILKSKLWSFVFLGSLFIIFLDFLIGLLNMRKLTHRIIIRLFYPALIIYGFFIKDFKLVNETKIERIF